MILWYSIKRDKKYLQGIEPNEKFCRSGTAPTMGTKYSYSEFKTIWGGKPKPFEMLTVTNYLKILLEEYRWENKKPLEIKIILYKEDGIDI